MRARARAAVVEHRECATPAEAMAEYTRLRQAGHTRAQAALVIERYLRRTVPPRERARANVDRKLAAAGRDGD